MLFGCGGGGGSSSSTSGSDSGATEISTRLRTIQPGDAWIYNVIVSGDYSGVAENTTVASNATIAGRECLSLVTTTAVQGGQNSTTSRYYIQSPSTADLLLLDESEPANNEPVLTVPGTWALGISFDKTIPNNNGGNHVSFVITDQEQVSVPAGRFQAWKTVMTQSTSFYNTSGTYWYAPEVGQFVKAEFSTSFTQGEFAGQSYRYNAELKSTNVFNR